MIIHIIKILNGCSTFQNIRIKISVKIFCKSNSFQQLPELNSVIILKFLYKFVYSSLFDEQFYKKINLNKDSSLAQPLAATDYQLLHLLQEEDCLSNVDWPNSFISLHQLLLLAGSDWSGRSAFKATRLESTLTWSALTCRVSST